MADFLLTGSKYWVVQGDQLLSGYPRDIYSSFGFPERVKKIDAAIYEEDTGHTSLLPVSIGGKDIPSEILGNQITLVEGELPFKIVLELH